MYFFLNITFFNNIFFQKDTILLLGPLEKATKYLSASSYPTMGDTRLVFAGIHAHLEKYAGDSSFAQREVAASISRKIEEYWAIMDVASTTSAILDPRSKLSVFSNESKSGARVRIQSIYELYRGRFSLRTDSTPPTPAKKTRQYFNLLRQNLAPTNNSTIELETETTGTELDRYLELPIDDEAEPLLWWQAHACEFPVLSSMARDYLTIQATSVASERAFSIAGNTITKARNRLLAETARACLCVKSWIDNDLVK